MSGRHSSGFYHIWSDSDMRRCPQGNSLMSCASFARNSGHCVTFENWTNYNLIIKTVPHHVLDMNGYVPVYSRVSYRSRPKKSSLPPILKSMQFKWRVTSALNPIDRTLRSGTESSKAARTSYLLQTSWLSSQYSCWADIPVFSMALDPSMFISASLLHSLSNIPAISLMPLHALLRGFTSLSSLWIICLTLLFPWVICVLYSCHPTRSWLLWLSRPTSTAARLGRA